MPQFDPLILFSLVWSLLLVLTCYYKVSIELLIPFFSVLGKFREKKLSLFETFNLNLIFKRGNFAFV